MYEKFLLYGMLIISSILLIIIFIIYTMDLALYFIGTKVKCEIKSYKIIPVGREFYLGQWHSLHIYYEYMYLNKIYQNNLLNFSNSVMRLNSHNLNKILNKFISRKNIYVLPFFPKVAIALPFTQDARFYVGFIFCLSCFVFSITKLKLI